MIDLHIVLKILLLTYKIIYTDDLGGSAVSTPWIRRVRFPVEPSWEINFTK